MEIFVFTWENIFVKFWLKMDAQMILIEQIPHVEIMCNRPICYPEDKRGFPWLVNIRENNKEVGLVIFEIIMEDSDNPFGSGLKS